VTRTLRVAEMLARDLLRRRLTLTLIVALPLAFYFSGQHQSISDHLVAGGIGASWSIAGSSLFATLNAREADVRLVLDGFRPAEILTGRFVLLLTLGAILGSSLGVMMLAINHPPHDAELMVAMLAVAAVAAPLGLAVGALVPHELEGLLLIIGVIGIQMSQSVASHLLGALPLGPAARLLDRAGGGGSAFRTNIARAGGWAVVLFVVAAFFWYLRVGVSRPRPQAWVWVGALAATAGGVVLVAAPLGTTTVRAASPSTCPLIVPATPTIVSPTVGSDVVPGDYTSSTMLLGSNGFVYIVHAGTGPRGRPTLVVARAPRDPCKDIHSQAFVSVWPYPATTGPLRLTGVRGDVVTTTGGQFNVVRLHTVP
jgi:hypothetical protein